MIWINLKKKIDEEENKRKNNWYGSLIDQLIIFQKKIQKVFPNKHNYFFHRPMCSDGQEPQKPKTKKKYLEGSIIKVVNNLLN